MGRLEFRLNQRIWLRLSSVFESRRISFFKIFLVSSANSLDSGLDFDRVLLKEFFEKVNFEKKS